MSLLTDELIEELTESLSLVRLSTVGFFKRMPYELGHGSIDVSREIAMHRAVLDKALVDYFSTNRGIRRDVIQWLSLDNQEFVDACERALLEPELVFKAFFAMKLLLKGDRAKFPTKNLKNLKNVKKILN